MKIRVRVMGYQKIAGGLEPNNILSTSDVMKCITAYICVACSFSQIDLTSFFHLSATAVLILELDCC